MNYNAKMIQFNGLKTLCLILKCQRDIIEINMNMKWDSWVSDLKSGLNHEIHEINVYVWPKCYTQPTRVSQLSI